MNSVSDPARAGSSGHRRGSRWFKGKFLVFFLAVATLMGGAALMAPQSQTKANAAGSNPSPPRDGGSNPSPPGDGGSNPSPPGDGGGRGNPQGPTFLNPVTWDVNRTGPTGASRYTSMLNAVRNRASGGQFLRGDTHQTRPSATQEFFTVNISVSDPNTTTPRQIRLVVRASDAFVVGWLNQNENIFTSLRGENAPSPVAGATQASVSFNGSYLELERRGGDRANITLGPQGIQQSVRDLSRSASTEAEQAKALIRLIQVICEAARFDHMEELVRSTFTSTEGKTPTPALMELENSWQPMSEIANRHVVNPNDPLTQELMRRHQNMLEQLGVFEQGERGVLTAVLALAISIVIP